MITTTHALQTKKAFQLFQPAREVQRVCLVEHTLYVTGFFELMPHNPFLFRIKNVWAITVLFNCAKLVFAHPKNIVEVP